MPDTYTLVHTVITGAIALGMLIFAAKSFLAGRSDKKQEEIDCLKRQIQTLETKCAVINERLDNEIHQLEQLTDKLDKMYELLLETE